MDPLERIAGFPCLSSGKPDEPIVLCLHGFPDTPHGWLPMAPLIAASGRRLVMPFLRGYAPAPLDGPFALGDLAADVVAMADALVPGGGTVDLVGHDWGALIAYTAVLAAPGRFRRAVAMSVPHPASFLGNLRADPRQLGRSWYMLFFQLPLIAEWALRARDFALVERLWRDWSPGWEPPRDALDAAKRCLAASLPAPLEYYRTMVRRLVGGERFPATPIATPTLYLHGERDGCIGPRLAEGQERCFAGPFRAEILPEVGHFLHLERPAAVAERIIEWLDADAPASAPERRPGEERP
jgi:pimeloyl-ACP methyl ester carboxylesterase